MTAQAGPARVFLSHTSDMARYPADRSFVRAALDALARIGMAPIDMRYFAARDGRPADYCQERMRDCDLYVALIGARYGSPVPGEDVSYTELEFVEATLLGLPRLVFLLGDDVALPVPLTDPDRTAVDAFRRRLRDADLVVATFATADGLELAVYQALVEWAAARRPVPRPVPRQLPAAVPHFAGRARDLAALDLLLRRRADIGGPVVISAVSGTAGVGKTALAVHWAHRVAHRFPDGQLYANLRGFDPDGRMVTSAEAIRGFLDALGVPPERIPADLDAQAALYRSQLAGRRMLVLLDNALDADQVRPLLPGAAAVLVLVTSRNRLVSLVAAEGAQLLTLDVLTAAEATELLAGRLGAERVAAEPGAVAEIITACARLPLALSIVAAQAAQAGSPGQVGLPAQAGQAAQVGFPLAAVAGELRREERRLDALDAGDPVSDVRSVFSWSYRALPAPVARLFRLLGLPAGPDIPLPAAVSLAGEPAPDVRRQLAELVRANLLVEHLPGRYAAHDLLRVYATELAHAHDSPAERRGALTRWYDHHLHTAYQADRLLYPNRPAMRLPLTDPAPGVQPETPADEPAALAWFAAEHDVLLALLRQAAETGFEGHAWRLAWALDTVLYRQGHPYDRAAVWQVGMLAARRLGETGAELYAGLYLARAETRIGRYADAGEHLRHSLNVASAADDLPSQAHAHRLLAMLWEQQGHPASALEHAGRALDLFRAAGHRAGEADALNSVGWCAALLGDYRQARDCCGRARTLYQEVGDQAGEAHAWDSLGYAHHHLGERDEAVHCYERAIALYRDRSNRGEEAGSLVRLGETYRAGGEVAAARRVWTEALEILVEIGDPGADDLRAKLVELDS